MLLHYQVSTIESAKFGTVRTIARRQPEVPAGGVIAVQRRLHLVVQSIPAGDAAAGRSMEVLHLDEIDTADWYTVLGSRFVVKNPDTGQLFVGCAGPGGFYGREPNNLFQLVLEADNPELEAFVNWAADAFDVYNSD